MGKEDERSQDASSPTPPTPRLIQEMYWGDSRPMLGRPTVWRRSLTTWKAHCLSQEPRLSPWYAALTPPPHMLRAPTSPTPLTPYTAHTFQKELKQAGQHFSLNNTTRAARLSKHTREITRTCESSHYLRADNDHREWKLGDARATCWSIENKWSYHRWQEAYDRNNWTRACAWSTKEREQQTDTKKKDFHYQTPSFF